MIRSTGARQKDKAFPQVALDYFDQLLPQYDLMLADSGEKRTAAIEALLARVAQMPAETSWADVFALESAYLYAIPDFRLQAEMVALRSRFRTVAGPVAYAEYERSVTLDLAKATTGQLRAELFALAGRIRYLYTFVPPKERIRNQLAQNAAWLTIGFFVFSQLVSVLCLFVFHAELPTILIVLFSGVLGGFLSVQQRLQAADDVDPLFKELQLTEGWFSVVVLSPLSGAVFACVLYWLFLAQLLSGGLFPTFGSGHSAVGSTSWEVFNANSAPDGVVSYGKLLVWSFIAGFAERFVPNVLTRIAGQAGATVQAPAAAKPAAVAASQSPDHDAVAPS
jgi:hypothetical protein